MERFIRMYDEASLSFYWADARDVSKWQADAQVARREFSRALEDSVLSKSQAQAFLARVYPVYPALHLRAPHPEEASKVPREAISTTWLQKHYGSVAFDEMVAKRIVELLPNVNACISNVPVKYIEE